MARIRGIGVGMFESAIAPLSVCRLEVKLRVT